MGLFSRKPEQGRLAEPEVRRPRARRAAASSDSSSDPLDPALIQKKRARRRLLGAITLTIAAVVFLPMVFDSEPQTTSDEISVELPARNSTFAPKAVAPTNSSGASLASQKPPVSGVYTVPPTQAVAAPGDTPAPASAPGATGTPAQPAASPPSRVGPDAPAAKAESAPAPAGTIKPDEKAPPASKAVSANSAAPVAPAKSSSPQPAAKAAAPSAEQQRALALLEGRSPPGAGPPTTPPTSGPVAPAASAAGAKKGSFAVQIAALASQEKVQELLDKLSGAGVKPYTEKVETAQGARTRVRLGPFATRDEAQKALERVKGMGLDGSLVTP
jgi:DedD protein